MCMKMCKCTHTTHTDRVWITYSPRGLHTVPTSQISLWLLTKECQNATMTCHDKPLYTLMGDQMLLYYYCG